MPKKLLKLTITKIDHPVFTGDVVSVLLPGVEGVMGLLANHEALITPLKKGVIKITKEDGVIENLEINGGILEISHNHATILI